MAAARAEADPFDRRAQSEVVSALEKVGGQEEALAWLMIRAESSGDIWSVPDALVRAGRPDEAVSWLRRRPHNHGSDYLAVLATYLDRAGHTDEALAEYQHASEAGSTYAVIQAASVLEKAGRVQDAIDWLQAQAAAAGAAAPGTPATHLARANILHTAAMTLERAGHDQEALAVWMSLAAEDPDFSLTYSPAVKIMERQGQTEDAINWLLSCTEAGSRSALYQAQVLLERVDRTEEATRLRQLGIEPGGQIAASID